MRVGLKGNAMPGHPPALTPMFALPTSLRGVGGVRGLCGVLNTNTNANPNPNTNPNDNERTRGVCGGVRAVRAEGSELVGIVK